MQPISYIHFTYYVNWRLGRKLIKLLMRNKRIFTKAKIISFILSPLNIQTIHKPLQEFID